MNRSLTKLASKVAVLGSGIGCWGRGSVCRGTGVSALVSRHWCHPYPHSRAISDRVEIPLKIPYTPNSQLRPHREQHSVPTVYCHTAHRTPHTARRTPICFGGFLCLTPFSTKRGSMFTVKTTTVLLPFYSPTKVVTLLFMRCTFSVISRKTGSMSNFFPNLCLTPPKRANLLFPLSPSYANTLNATDDRLSNVNRLLTNATDDRLSNATASSPTQPTTVLAT